MDGDIRHQTETSAYASYMTVEDDTRRQRGVGPAV